MLTPTTTSVLIIPNSKQCWKIKSSCSAKTCVCHTFTARKPRAFQSQQGPGAIGSSLSCLPSPQSRGHLPFCNNFLSFGSCSTEQWRSHHFPEAALLDYCRALSSLLFFQHMIGHCLHPLGIPSRAQFPSKWG